MLTVIPNEGISSSDGFQADDLFALSPSPITPDMPFDGEFPSNNDISSSDDVTLMSLISSDDTGTATDGCSSTSPLSRRTRKRTDECSIAAPGNPSVGLPNLDNDIDWASEGLQERWCSETTSSVFGNVPVCAASIQAVSGLFENIYGYRCKYSTCTMPKLFDILLLHCNDEE